MYDLALVRTRNNPAPGVKKNSDSGAYSGRRMPPFGIMNIAAYARQQGNKVKMFDLFRPEFDDLSIEAVADQIIAERPRMVGISSMTSQSVDAMALGDLLKERSDITVVHGGVHPATTPHDHAQGAVHRSQRGNPSQGMGQPGRLETVHALRPALRRRGNQGAQREADACAILRDPRRGHHRPVERTA